MKTTRRPPLICAGINQNAKWSFQMKKLSFFPLLLYNDGEARAGAKSLSRKPSWSRCRPQVL